MKFRMSFKTGIRRTHQSRWGVWRSHWSPKVPCWHQVPIWGRLQVSSGGCLWYPANYAKKMLTISQITNKLRRKKRDFYFSQTEDYNQKTDSQKLWELFHCSGGKMQFYTFLWQRICVSYWPVTIVHNVLQRFFFFWSVMYVQRKPLINVIPFMSEKN